MRVNVCVNGTFRYPQYIRHYREAGVLNRFVFAHRRSTDAGLLGLEPRQAVNVWAKEYLLHGALRCSPAALAPRLYTAIGDLWQEAAIRTWSECDSLEAVIGAVADRLIAHAKRRGSRVIGHAVNAHPALVQALMSRARADLGLDPDRAMFHDLDRRKAEIEACDAVLVDSRFVLQSFVAAGVSPAKLHLVRPGLDRARFRPRHPREVDRTIFRVVCVGTLSVRKGQRYLLHAWRRLALPRSELVLVGPVGRDAASVVRGHQGGFVHYPRVANDQLRALLVTASAFVLPSIEDGFSQAAMEAMACGLPTIVTANNGVADVIDHGVDGLVVPAFDAEAIAQAIKKLYEDKDGALALGLRAAAKLHGSASWKAYAADVLHLHRNLVDGAAACEAA